MFNILNRYSIRVSILLLQAVVLLTLSLSPKIVNAIEIIGGNPTPMINTQQNNNTAPNANNAAAPDPKNPQAQYTGRGVEASIRALLCAPSEASNANVTRDSSLTLRTDATVVDNPAGNDLTNCINKGYRFALAFGAVAAIFFVVLAGYMYMVGGEHGKTKAKEVIVSVLVGFLIMLSSFVLLRQINPTLTTFRTIQPPKLAGTYSIATCEELNLGKACTAGDGDNVPGDSTAEGIGISDSGGPGVEKDGIVKGGPRYNNFPRWFQGDPPWGTKRYGNKSNCSSYRDGACGPSAFAEVVQYFMQNGGAKIPADLAAKYGNQMNPYFMGQLTADKGFRVCPGGTEGRFVAALAPAFGLKGQAASWSTIQAGLEKGTPAVVSMRGPGPFTSGGHFIVLVAKVGDQIYTVDSFTRNITRARADIVQRYFKYGSMVTSPTFTPPTPR